MSSLLLGTVLLGAPVASAPAPAKKTPRLEKTQTAKAQSSMQAQSSVKPVHQQVSLWVSRDVAPGPKIRLTVNTRNVAQVRLSARRLSGFSWLLRRDRGDSQAEPTGALVREWIADMRPPQEKRARYQVDMYRSRQLNLPELPPGIYVIRGEGGGTKDWAVVNITNLAVVVKRSPQRLLAWVTDFRSGVPVAGARVSLWQRSSEAGRESRLMVQATTGRNGASLLTAAGDSAKGDSANNQILIASRGSDNAGVPLTVENPDGKLTMHFQTDRPIYRPGQKVFFKAILRRTRGRSWESLRGTACDVQVRDARDVVLFEQKLQTNAIGSLEGSVDLPQEGSLGQYSVTVSAVGGTTQYGAFSVAAYRKPEFQVSVVPGARRYLSGEKVFFTVKANYYFGAAVSNATVRYIVRRADLPFAGDDDGSGYWYGGDGNLYARDTYAHNDVVADSTIDLDAKGEVTLAVPSLSNGGDATYSINATVVDGSRRQVQGTASVPVYRAAKRLSVQGEVSYVPVGYLMPLRLRVADLDGKATGGRVTLVLKKPVWDEKEHRQRYVEVTRSNVDVPPSGLAKATLPAQAEGELLIEARMPDGSGRTAVATWSFWVAGPQTQWQREETQPAITLKPDKRWYQPGTVARVLVTSNVTSRPILAVAEGLDIWAYTVIPAGKRNFVWHLPAQLEMSPTAYVGAVQWTRNGLISTNAILPIPDPSRKLQVSITSDHQEYRPGQSARYSLRTTDEQGRGVSAEVAVSVVDESLYAVRPDTTPDLYGLFWAMRPNFVTMASSAPEEMSGGAYQRVNKMAPVRQQFLDTAFWRARLQTNAQGMASFEVPMPGNLTTWRATARAITADTRVGQATSFATATRPVTLRLATPRQLVQGDELTLIGTVNNRTQENRTLATALSAQGLQLSAGHTHLVPAPARGEGRAEWPLVANSLPESGEAKLTARTLDVKAAPTEGEELSDALEMSVRVLPNGILQRLLQGGTFAHTKDISITLPPDQIAPATTGILSIRGGVGQVAHALASNIVSNHRYASPVAAARLLVAALLPEDAPDDEAREDIALLARYQTGQGGWGWWEDDQPNALNTALVLSTLARAQARGIRVPTSLMLRGTAGAQALYNNTQLWEHRALLAAAIALVDHSGGTPLLDEVQRRAENLSPYARLVLGEALLEVGRKTEAEQVARDVLAEAVEGPSTAFVRVGQRPGWTATTVDATAAALSLLLQLGQRPELQGKLALWSADPDDGHGYSSLESSAVRLRALWKYEQAHPSSVQRGTISVVVNGQNVPVPTGNEKRPLEILLPRGVWRDGANTVSINRAGEGEIFYALETRVYRPATSEYRNGIRVLRRYDVQNEGKAWDELKRPVRAGEPVRCTVVIWPDERADALRVVEPIPAGFEYVEDDQAYGAAGLVEVRDGAVVHYVRGSGLPLTFRYYLRAETAGRVTALPVTAEVLRRPDERGNSDSQRIEVQPAR
ncbi:MAG TPA: MG2 domain-containing protein [Abditibacteriaceae bacterium]|jgi:hypothetical protein